MDSKSDMKDALELLKWQLELGVDENVGNIPLRDDSATPRDAVVPGCAIVRHRRA